MPIYHAHRTCSSHTPWHLILQCFHFMAAGLVSPPSLVRTPEPTTAFATPWGPYLAPPTSPSCCSFSNCAQARVIAVACRLQSSQLIRPTQLYLCIFPEWSPKHGVSLHKALPLPMELTSHCSIQDIPLLASIYLSRYLSSSAILMYLRLCYIPLHPGFCSYNFLLLPRPPLHLCL